MDVCRALGWPIGRAHGGTTQYLRGLREDEKRTIRRTEGLCVPLFTLFAKTNASVMGLISESGLYKLVMRSDKPEAREFQDWVTRVVLPDIRKDGAYIMGEEKVAMPPSMAAIKRRSSTH